MSIETDRRLMQSKTKAQAEHARKAADLRSKEARKRVDASKAQESAARSKNPSQIQSKQREASRALEAANKFGRDASILEGKAASCGSEAAKLQVKIARAEAAESQRAARQQQISQRADDRRRRELTSQLAATNRRLEESQERTEVVLKALTSPKSEKLRILMVGASPEGDLRVAREHTRIRRAVEVAAHRDQVEIDPRLSATGQDLQEGIAKFRPHIVHFSGHGDEKIIALEEDTDGFHPGIVVTANAFASACAATDTPPTLIVFNACNSAETADALVARFAPLAIGMRGSIEDADALSYATALYSYIANGQSVVSAHLAGKAAIELSGGQHELPYLASASGVDPAAVILVKPPAGVEAG